MPSFRPIKDVVLLFLLVIVMPQMGGCGMGVGSGSEPIDYDDFDDFEYTSDDIPETPDIPETIYGFGLNEDILEEAFVFSFYYIYYIFGQDGRFLGFVNDKWYDSTSMCDIYGPYGNEYSNTSLFYSYGIYGSDYSDYSAFDDFASNPPVLYEDDVAVAYVSTNSYFFPRVDPFYLMYLLNTLECGVSRW